MSCETNYQNILWLAACYVVAAKQGRRGLTMLLTVRPTHPSAQGLTISILLCCGRHQAYFYSYSLVCFFPSEIEHCCAKENRRNNNFEVCAETQILLWGPKWQEWDRQQQVVHKRSDFHSVLVVVLGIHSLQKYFVDQFCFRDVLMCCISFFTAW